MKKAVKANISGVVFYIDEDAYVLLENYLLELGRHFGQTEEGKEILSDVESRIAELLSLKIGKQKQGVTINDIKEVMETLGQPGDFTDSSSYEENTYGTTKTKRMYRDTENRILGGVCSGLGHYFGVDRTIIRVLSVLSVLIFGTGTFIYLILWILLPVASSRSQRMEMMGEPVNLSNIEQTIRDEFEKVKKQVGL